MPHLPPPGPRPRRPAGPYCPRCGVSEREHGTRSVWGCRARKRVLRLQGGPADGKLITTFAARYEGWPYVYPDRTVWHTYDHNGIYQGVAGVIP